MNFPVARTIGPAGTGVDTVPDGLVEAEGLAADGVWANGFASLLVVWKNNGENSHQAMLPAPTRTSKTAVKRSALVSRLRCCCCCGRSVIRLPPTRRYQGATHSDILPVSEPGKDATTWSCKLLLIERFWLSLFSFYMISGAFAKFVDENEGR